MKEVERICRESNCYEPERVKNFLKVSNGNYVILTFVCTSTCMYISMHMYMEIHVPSMLAKAMLIYMYMYRNNYNYMCIFVCVYMTV